MAKKKSDVYANRAFEEVIMSGANAITFQQIRFGVGIFQGVALVIHRLEFYPTRTTIDELLTVSDRLEMALVNRDDLAVLQADNQNIIALKMLYPMMVGAVVGIQEVELPLVVDYGELPEGGLIVPANPLYLAANTAGFTGAGAVRCIMFYTFKQLADSDYIELVQGMLPANI